MAKLVIGNWNFESKKAAIAKCEEIIGAYQTNQFLIEPDLTFVKSLLDLHPLSSEKIGCGVKGIYVGINPYQHHVNSFFVKRMDGTECVFSHAHCLSTNSKKHLFNKAARDLVMPSIMTFKQNFFNGIAEALCPFTSEVITEANCHVDHIAPKTFKSLLTDFVKLYEIDIENIQIDIIEGGRYHAFTDKTLSSKWIQYHDSNCHLQVVSARANLTVLRDKGIAKPA